MCGGNPIIIETTEAQEFRLTPEALRQAITKKTKVLILPYPNNPTGGIMEKKDLEQIVPILMEHDIFVVSDEIYAELTYGMKSCFDCVISRDERKNSSTKWFF